MKIIEENTSEDLSDVVAYETQYNNLVIQDPVTKGVLVFFEKSPLDFVEKVSAAWQPERATRLYRKGDRITLEF